MSRIINPFGRQAPLVQQPHIISRFLLNQFADEKKFFWKYLPRVAAKRVSTKSQCTQDGYFGVVDPREGSITETWLAQLENRAAPLIRKLDRRTWDLNDEERATLLLFMATLFYRSPKIRVLAGLPHVRQTLEAQLTQENIRDHQHRLLQRGTLVEAEALRKGVADHIDLILSDPAQLQFTDLFQRSWKLADMFSRKGFSIIRAQSNAFITSDSPVFPMTLPENAPAHTGGGLADTSVAVFLALSPRTLLVVGPAGTGWAEFAEPDFVKDLQSATVEAADRVVFAFEKIAGLQTHVDDHLGRVIYGPEIQR